MTETIDKETIDKKTIDEYFEKLFEKLKPLKPLLNSSDDLIKKLVLLAQHPVEIDIAVQRIKDTQRIQQLMNTASNVSEAVKGMSEAAATTTETINPLTGKTEFHTKGGAPIEIDKEFE